MEGLDEPPEDPRLLQAVAAAAAGSANDAAVGAQVRRLLGASDRLGPEAPATKRQRRKAAAAARREAGPY